MKRSLQILHWVIMINFFIGIAYAVYMVFSVSEIHGPLFGRVAELPFELVIYRRLYAIEAWIIILGFAFYLGLTEILPRKIRGERDPGK